MCMSAMIAKSLSRVMKDSTYKDLRYKIRMLAQWSLKWRWVMIVVVGVILFSTEIYEFIQLSFQIQSFHVIEMVLYLALLFGTGLFLELFVRLNSVYTRMVQTLEYKHTLSLELTKIDDWECLTAKLAELPAKIANAEEAFLVVSKPFNGRFEVEAHWAQKDGEPSEDVLWNPTIPCPKCFEKDGSRKNRIHLCSNDPALSSYSIYSLGITDRNLPAALLKFRMQPGHQLTHDEEKIFNNIGDEIAFAMHASQDRKRLTEMQSAQVAMAERRMVSAYIHDQLGQNLGYLHLKLDQLGADKSIIKSKEARADLNRLREVANDSYEIVRNILEKIQPETIPHLSNLLKEHARRVSRMANFELNFQSIGESINLVSDTEQAIFYVFREILSNVERHSKASNVGVLVDWADGALNISVADNGVGFDPESVRKDEHFGLEIMQERVAKLNGQVRMTSSAEAGTVISISIPLKSIDKASS